MFFKLASFYYIIDTLTVDLVSVHEFGGGAEYQLTLTISPEICGNMGEMSSTCKITSVGS